MIFTQLKLASLHILLGIILLSSFSNKIYGQLEVPLCYDLIWHDEFSGSALDLTKWKYQNGTWNGSNVQNCYVSDNVSVSNGSLQIEAKYEQGHQCFQQTVDFTSGFIQTKDLESWTFGYFEAKVKVPASNSTWPAFWLSPQTNTYGVWPQSGEIDVFEIKGHDMTTTYGNAHWGNAPGDKRQQKGPFHIADATQWHVYAVEWNLGELKFYLDGHHYHTINDFKEPNAGTDPQPFDIPFYLRLNMAVGGDYLEAPWNDAYFDTNQLPAIMEVDYVRVYQLNTGCTSQNNCELLQNGGFTNGTNNWSLFKSNGTDGNLSVDNDGFLEVDISATGSSDWQLALRQTDILLETSNEYTVSYVAYADAPRSSNIIISKSDGTQYHYQSQPLTTTPTYYSWSFNMTATTDPNSYINFGVGSVNPSVYYENISISKSNCKPCQYNYAIYDQNIDPGLYQVENKIISDGKVVNPLGTYFNADEIDLLPYFETTLGALFEANNNPCSN